MPQLTDNFHSSEFDCKDGNAVPAHLMTNVMNLAVNLQVLRDHIGQPLFITSGYRSPDHNKRVGGKKDSQHLNAKAADLTTKNKTPKQLAVIIEKLIAQGKMKAGGVGIYPGFVHYDIRGRNDRW